MLNTTKQAIESVYDSQNSAIKMVRSYEKRMKNLYENLKNDEEIDEENYKAFCDITETTLVEFNFDAKSVLTGVKDLYNILLK
jgi:hypothetical protein